MNINYGVLKVKLKCYKSREIKIKKLKVYYFSLTYDKRLLNVMEYRLTKIY